jgi:histone H3/H4
MDDGSGDEKPGPSTEALRATEEEHQNVAEDCPASDPGNLIEADSDMVKNSMEIDFPKSVLKRLVKEKMKEFLTEESQDPEKEKRIQDAQISKEALMAFNEAAKLFIYYVTSTANDICRESKRQTISAEDVFKALGEIDFEEFVKPLRDSLQGD